MIAPKTASPRANATRTKLLEAARDVIRAKGYAATTVDDICAAAGVTKGGFFHHFPSKERLGLDAIDLFNTMAASLFAAPFATALDPRDRLLGYIDLRASLLNREIPQFTCLLGTLVQEIHATHPALRDACDAGMTTHVATLTRDIEAAKALYARDADWSAESLGYFMQSVLQGAFVFAKAKQNPAVVAESLAHLKRYLIALLGKPEETPAP